MRRLVMFVGAVRPEVVGGADPPSSESPVSLPTDTGSSPRLEAMPSGIDEVREAGALDAIEREQ
jgi:hypothetical protein